MTGIHDGWMRLYDEVDPGLDAGQYRISAALEIQHSRGGALSAPLPESAFLEVVAPRFALEPSEVAASHPPQGAHGDFSSRLPHVVLGRRSLAWERRLPGGTPWLALLVFRKDEAQLAGPLPLRAAVGASVFDRLAALAPIEGDGPPVTTVTFQSSHTLRRILPTPTEVGLLCHARHVSLTDSSLAMGDDDGWFAVVTANRLPLASNGPTAYVAALISLEGREDLWSQLPSLPPGTPAPPLVVLYRWEFTSSSGGTFEDLAQGLDSALFGAPKAGEPALVAEDGTLALSRTDRRGAQGPARYRGPLVATAPGASPSLPEGPGHISAATAYELGRLMGAADGRFTREIVSWHRATDSGAVAAASLRETAAALEPVLGESSLASVAAPASLPEMIDRLRQMAKGAQRPADPWGVHPAAVRSLERQREADPTRGERPLAPIPAAQPASKLARLSSARTAAARRGSSGGNHG
jgi:hypothetical protein